MSITTFTASPPRPLPDAGFGPEDRVPSDFHRTLPGYAVTPLHDCPSLAECLGVGRVLVKDESSRLGLPSFKILGASWATVAAIREHWLPDVPPSLPALRDSLAGSGRALIAATDGNHGRGVARMAKLLGLACRILVPEGTAQARIDAIASEGATVEVVDGTYDDAIAASAALAGPDAVVVSDTSWPGYEDTPRAVVAGYSTMFHEIDDQLRDRDLPAPTFVVLQSGVGSFAAAGVRHYRGDPAATTRVVVVEPNDANCLMAAAVTGRLTLVPGPHRSSMAGLNCGLPSELVWPILRAGVEAYVGIDDRDAYDGMRSLAGLGIVAGESGAAGVGALLAAAARDAGPGRTFGLGPDDCVLVVNTEGATDPVNYAAVVGGPAAEVMGGPAAEVVGEPVAEPVGV